LALSVIAPSADAYIEIAFASPAFPKKTIAPTITKVTRENSLDLIPIKLKLEKQEKFSMNKHFGFI
jgi:hypothetical protein